MPPSIVLVMSKPPISCYTRKVLQVNVSTMQIPLLKVLEAAVAKVKSFFSNAWTRSHQTAYTFCMLCCVTIGKC